MRSSNDVFSSSSSQPDDKPKPPSPVLLMLSSAEGLTGVALDAARPLRLARDEQQPRITRLDALGLFIKRLPKVMPDQQVLNALTVEALDLFEPPLSGARLTELRISLSARGFNLHWDLLNCADWDLDSLQMKALDHQARTLLDFVFKLPIRPFWHQPLSELLQDTEEAAAAIRLMRLYVHLNVLTLPEDSSSADVLRQCSRAMGLWRHAETALPRLPTRPRGPVGLYDPPPASLFDAEGPGPGRWRDAAPCPAEVTAAAMAELVRQSRALRQDMIHQLAGQADLWAGWRANVSPSRTRPGFGTQGFAEAPATALSKNKPPLVGAAKVLEQAQAAAAQALAAHDLLLARRFPNRCGGNTLRAATTSLVITDPIPSMSDRDHQSTLASYETLRSPLPVALLPPADDLRTRITGLQEEFPWAVDAIGHVGDEMLARQQLGALTFTWFPLLLVGPPGTGKTRLARRLAEVMGLPFLPISVASSDSRLLTGTSRGWSSGEPSPIVRLLRDRRTAQAVVLLDELDKSALRFTNAVPFHAALLGLLEAESSKRWLDSFLQVPCDLSRVLFVATANGLSGLDAVLLSRMQPVLVPAPERHHYPVVAQQVMQDVAQDWGLPVEVLPPLDLAGLTRAAGSVRELVRLVRREIVRASQSLGPRH